MLGLCGWKIPCGLSIPTQAWSVHNLNSVLISQTSASPLKPSGAGGGLFKSAIGTAYSTATNLSPP